MSSDPPKNQPGYGDLLQNLRDRIDTARLSAAQSINRELVLLYWAIGREILDRQEQEDWGAKVINHIATDLRRTCPEMRGLSSPLRKHRYAAQVRGLRSQERDRQFVRTNSSWVTSL